MQLNISKYVLLALLAVPALAAPTPAPQYQDGVLVSFKDIATGTNCSSSGDVNGNGATNSDTTCSDRVQRHYTVKVGDTIFVLIKGWSTKQKVASRVSLGWATAFSQGTVLDNQLPGTRLQVRSDNHGIYVKLGKKESLYSVVEAK